MSNRLVIEHPGQLANAVPHLLGFVPTESLIVVPLTPDLPVARIDLPGDDGITQKELGEYCNTLLPPYTRYSTHRSRLALVAISSRQPLAEHVSAYVGHTLERIPVNVGMRVWSDGRQWHEAIADTSGQHTIAEATRFAAERAFSGALLPTQTRAALSESLVGDRTQLGRHIEHAVDRTVAVNDDPTWALERVRAFHHDGLRFSDHDAARLLVDLSGKKTRDALWADMQPQTATSHKTLWTDMVRRAPDEVRTPAAALLGFSSWLTGDGATAWCALDQIPAPHRDNYVLADLVAASLTEGLHPREWYRVQQTVTSAGALPPPPSDPLSAKSCARPDPLPRNSHRQPPAPER